MGTGFGIKCTACDYSLSVIEGFGLEYSTYTLFYGFRNDPSQNWSVAFLDSLGKNDKPLLFRLVKSDIIRKRAFSLLESGAIPTDYGHELYVCPKCCHLHNMFYFQLQTENEKFEPEYECTYCHALLKRAGLKADNETLKVVYRNNKEVDWRCPECGSNRMAHDGSMGFWD